MSRPSIPRSAVDLTAPWLTSVLDHAGSNAVAQSVTSAEIGTGQMATSMRISVLYETNPDDLPSSFVVKLASSDPSSRGAGARGAYLREVRFYQELAADLAVATPASWWADINEETHDFAILLEDMDPATQGDQISGCTVEHLRSAAINVAGLHAPSWQDSTLAELSWLTSPADEMHDHRVEMEQLIGMVTPGFIDRYAATMTPAHVELLTWFATNVAEYMADNGGCLALMHGDHRLDNLLFNDADTSRPVTVVDWQTVSLRNPVADISYLLGTSVAPDVRRDVEHDIVADYHSRLVDLGVTNYSLETCFEHYRAQSLHALILTVLGSMLTGQTPRGDEMFMAMLHRSSQQISDLDVR